MLSRNWFFISLLLLFVAGYAQEPAGRAERVKELYESLQFEKAVQLSRLLLKTTRITSPQELITIHQYAGFSFFNLGQPDSAKKHFFTILSIDPEYQFNPVNTSPKIIKFFNKIKENYQKSASSDNQKGYVRYIFLQDLRPGATWRSALMPGWGQYFKGQKKRSKIFGAAFWGGVTISAVSYLLENHYHQQYLDAKIRSDIQDKYDTYNFWYKTRRVSLYFTAAVWVSSVLDAFWVPYSSSNLSVGVKDNTSISLQISF